MAQFINVPICGDPRVMYLIIIDKMVKINAGLLKIRLTEKFNLFVRELVIAHVVEGKQPPKQIESVVMNIADDIMAGRDAVLRAGDYISLVGYAKKMRKL